jgi:(3S)-malyl-CoA thioesterase
MTLRPFRSALYIPGSKARALDKARSLSADAILFDLEDAVAPDEKTNARGLLTESLAQGGYGSRYRIVRINGLDTPWGAADVAAVAGADCDAVLLPKVATPAQIDALAALIPGKPVWAMIESPQGVLAAAAIAAHPALEGMVMGTNDLAKDMNLRKAPRREPLLHALQASVLAARAFDRIILDGVYNAFKDSTGLAEECEQGRDMGFDGKSLIHPDQIAAANAAFAPTEAETDLARRQIAAFDAAVAAGQGVAVLDGRIVENLHIVTARATLAKAAAIAALQTGEF